MSQAMKANSLVVPFQLHGHFGRITVQYARNQDAHDTGYDYLFALANEKNSDLNKVLYFPVMNATVQYDGSGYRQLLGWVQIVINEFPRTKKKTEFILDHYQSLDGKDIPFSCFGFNPSYFDAPATWNPKMLKNFVWKADTFLTTFPILSRTEEIAWIAGFSWGYEFPDDSPRPDLLPLQRTGPEVWNNHLAFLKAKSRNWEFKTAGP